MRPGGRIALLDVGIPHNKFIRLGQRHLLRQDRAQDRRAAVRRRRLPVPPQERRLPADAGRDGVDAPAVRVHEGRCTRTLSGGLTQLLTATRRMIARTVAARVRPGPERRRRVATVTCSCAKESVSRVAASRHVCRSTRRSSFLAAIEHDDEVGETNGPIALGALPFLPGAPATLVVPAVVVGKDAGGRAWVTRIDGADDPLVSVAEPVPTAASYTLRPLVDGRPLPGRRRRRPRRGPRRADGEGRDRPPDRGRVGPADRRPCRAAPAQGDVRFEPPLLDRRLHRRLARAAGRGRRRHRAVVPARRHDAHDRRSRARRQARGRAAGQPEEPDRAPRRDRDGARHAAPLLQLSRLGARARDRQGRQRAAPRLAGRGSAVQAACRR